MSTRYAGAARVAALALLWGSSFLWIKIGLDGFSPVQITLFRMALGAAALLGILHLRGTDQTKNGRHEHHSGPGGRRGARAATRRP